jgi:hypothetical protein
MTERVIDVRISGPNALWVENERHDIRAGGDGGIGDYVHDAGREGLVSIFGAGFSKELPRAAVVDVRPLPHTN